MDPTSDSLRVTADAIDIWPGKPCQQRRIGTEQWVDMQSDSIIINLGMWEYRPTPARKFRPWTTEEVPLGCHITNGIGRWVIDTVYDNKVFLDGCGWIDMYTLFARFTQLANGQPCGTEEA